MTSEKQSKSGDMKHEKEFLGPIISFWCLKIGDLKQTCSYFKHNPPKIPSLFAISAAISDIQPHLPGMLDSDDSASWGNFPGVRRWWPGGCRCSHIVVHVWNRFSQIHMEFTAYLFQATCMGEYSRHGASGNVVTIRPKRVCCPREPSTGS